MKIEKIIENLNALGRFASEDTGKSFKLNPTVRFKLANLIASLNEAYKSFETKRLALVEKYGDAGEGEQKKVSDPEKLKGFNEELQPYLDHEYDVVVESLLKKDILGSNEGNQVSLPVLSDLMRLEILSK